MTCCNEKCKKFIAFGISTLLIVLGIVLVTLWHSAYEGIINNEFAIRNHSKGFDNWIVTPIPMYLTFYMYNWTNAHEVVYDWSIKPKFVEMGPYVFSEKHYRVNIKWNPNNTLTYDTKRVWHFVPEKSNGSLSDEVSTVNVIATTVANMVKDKNFFIKKGASFFIQEKEHSLIVKKNVSQWIFDGYNDELLVLAKQMNLSGLNMDKFGWFYGRNNSETYDGSVTMYTGTDDIELLGVFEEWNGNPKTFAYKSYCGYVNGTSGELWPPVKKYKKVFIYSSDICSSLALFSTNHTPIINGIEGKEFIGTDFLFDNGTKYADQWCFQGSLPMPSGVRDVSKCKNGAPAFISYPHFYLADPYYLNQVDGLKPDPKKHTFNVTLEPNTGVPLLVNARLQLNIQVTRIPGITMFEKVKQTMIPVFWFEQSAELTEDLASQVKMVLILPALGTYTAIGMIAFGSLIFTIAAYISIKNAWRDGEHSQLLPHDKM